VTHTLVPSLTRSDGLVLVGSSVKLDVETMFEPLVRVAAPAYFQTFLVVPLSTTQMSVPLVVIPSGVTGPLMVQEPSGVPVSL